MTWICTALQLKVTLFNSGWNCFAISCKSGQEIGTPSLWQSWNHSYTNLSRMAHPASCIDLQLALPLLDSLPVLNFNSFSCCLLISHITSHVINTIIFSPVMHCLTVFNFCNISTVFIMISTLCFLWIARTLLEITLKTWNNVGDIGGRIEIYCSIIEVLEIWSVIEPSKNQSSVEVLEKVC